MGKFKMAYVHTAIEINRVYRYVNAVDHTAGLVYRQKSANVNTAGHVVSSTKMAIHRAGGVYSHFVLAIITQAPVRETRLL